KRAETIRHGASAVGHAVRSGDHGGGGSSVDLSEGERCHLGTAPSPAAARQTETQTPNNSKRSLDLRGNYRCSDDLPYTTGACPSRSRLTKRQRRFGTNALDPPARRPRTGA